MLSIHHGGCQRQETERKIWVNLNVKYLIAQNIEAAEAVQGEQIYQKADQQEIAMLEDVGEKILDVSENKELPEGRPAMEEILYSHAGLKNVALLDNMNLECMLEVDFLYVPIMTAPD